MTLLENGPYRNRWRLVFAQVIEWSTQRHYALYQQRCGKIDAARLSQW